MTNIGIIGLGFMSVQHIKAYRQIPNANIAALCNPSGRHLDGDFSDVAGNVGDQEPVKLDMKSVKTFTDFAAMLNDPDIDLIDICTPTRTHEELCIQALKSGKHVLCEKPLARTSKAAARIAAAAKEATGYFMPAMCLRFWPEWLWLRNHIQNKTYGEVRDARFRRVAEPPPWGQQNYFDGAVSGGGLMDIHIHDTDFVQYCFGKPKSVYSQGYTKHSGAIDHVVTLYTVDSGAVVSAEGSWTMTPSFGFNMAYTVNFEQATVDYDIARGDEALKVYQEGKEPEIVTCEGGDGYQGELNYFIKCIESGTPPTTVTAQDGLYSVQICEAEEKSATDNVVVDVA